MMKLVMALGGAGLAALATVLAVALAGNGQTTTARVGTLPTTVADVSGPCDEAEHANDPRCTGATAPQPQADDDDGANHEAGDDHGDDSITAQSDDDGPNHDVNDDHGNHDRGNDDDHGGHGGGGGDDDRSGSNSGRG
jgi:hypothetical protein